MQDYDCHIICPCNACGVAVEQRDIRQVLGDADFDRYMHRSLMTTVEADDSLITCPRCAVVVEKLEAIGSPTSAGSAPLEQVASSHSTAVLCGIVPVPIAHTTHPIWLHRSGSQGKSSRSRLQCTADSTGSAAGNVMRYFLFSSSFTSPADGLSQVFCSACHVEPYHIGFTCSQYALLMSIYPSQMTTLYDL